MDLWRCTSQALVKFIGMSSTDRELQFASINFDGAHERGWCPWLSAPPRCPGITIFGQWIATVAEIARHGITIACFTPAYLHPAGRIDGRNAGAESAHPPIQSAAKR